MIEGVVAPFDHVFPVLADELSVTVWPEQTVVAPVAVIVGATGVGLTVTVIVFDGADVHTFAETVA